MEVPNEMIRLNIEEVQPTLGNQDLVVPNPIPTAFDATLHSPIAMAKGILQGQHEASQGMGKPEERFLEEISQQ